MANGGDVTALLAAREIVFKARTELVNRVRLIRMSNAPGFLSVETERLWARIDEHTAQIRQADVEIAAYARETEGGESCVA